MNAYLEVDFVLLSVVVLGAVFTAHASVASAHGHLDTISTSSLYLAVTFAVTGLSFPSWCNDRGYGPDIGTCRNLWSFCRCSSWTRLRRARRASTTGLLVLTVQTTFLDKLLTCSLLCTSSFWRVGENPWSFHRCSSWTRCTRPLLLCGAVGQTVQKTVVVP